MNTIYLVKSILECVDRELVCQQTHVKVCNLEPSMGTVVLLLSILTSAAMLGYKAARTLASAYCCGRHTMPSPIRRLHCGTHLCRSTALNAFVEPYFAAEAEILRSQRNEAKRLQAERSALIAELEATLSPHAVVQVQAAMQRVGSRGNLLSSHQPSQSDVAIDD
jgi:hypothetical protein